MENPVRLLICTACNSVEEMPDYEGPWKYDTWQNTLLANHMLSSGEKTHGDVHVARIEQEDWLLHKNDILAKMSSEFTKPGDGVGLGKDFYDTKDNFSVDAFKCWQQHGRRLNCEEYQSDKKKLKPDTRAERKAEGMEHKHRPSIFLCDFCPVHAHVLQKKKSEAFGYNYDV